MDIAISMGLCHICGRYDDRIGLNKKAMKKYPLYCKNCLLEIINKPKLLKYR